MKFKYMRNFHNMFDTESPSFHNKILIECYMNGNPGDTLEHVLEQIYDELFLTLCVLNFFSIA